MSDDVWDRFEPGDTERLLVNGRYQFPCLDDSLMRVSNLVGVLADDHGLNLWRNHTAAKGFANNPLLLRQATEVNARGFDAIFQAAIDNAGGGEARDAGTAFHDLTARIDAGAQDGAGELQGAVDAYHAALAEWGFAVEPHLVERVVAIPSIGAAGTFDRIVRHVATGRLFIADIKTGGLRWFKFAQQLAIYARAEQMWNGEDQAFEPMPNVSTTTGIVIGVDLATETAELWEVDLEEPWRWVQSAVEVLEWRRAAARKNVIARPWGQNPPVDELLDRRRAWLRRELERLQADHLDAFMGLAAEWPDGVPTPKQGGQTHAQLDLVAELLVDIERRFDLPFGDHDPGGDKPIDVASPAAVDDLKNRLRALPTDLLIVVEAAAAEAGVTSLDRNACPVDVLASLEQVLSPAEVEAAQRDQLARNMIAETVPEIGVVCGGEEIWQMVEFYGTGPLWSERHIDLCSAICEALAAGVLTVDDGDVVVSDNALELLVAHTGGKRELLALGRRLAEEYGIDTPGSSADVADDPLLAAVTTAA